MSADAVHTIGLLEEFTTAEDRLLDVGCGSCEVAFFLERRGYRGVSNVDKFDLRRFEVEDYRSFDGLNLPFDDGEFDVVCLNFVLHHVPDHKKVALLREAARVSRRLLFVLEDTPRNPIDRLIAHIHGLGYKLKIGSPEAYGFYRQDEWEALFRDHGLEIVESRRQGRFCRKWHHPLARSLFVLEKRETGKPRQRPAV